MPRYGRDESQRKRCRWCGKRYKRLSGVEKQHLDDSWSEMCVRCNNKHQRILSTNPFAALCPPTRPLSREDHGRD